MTKKQILTKETSLIKTPKDNALTFGEQLIWASTFAVHFTGKNTNESIEKASEAIVELRKAQDNVNIKISGENYLWLTQMTGKQKWK